MAVNVNNLSTYTDAECVVIVRAAIMDSVFAESYTINGRSLARHSMSDLTKLLEFFEARAAAASSNTGGRTATVRFGRPQ